ncbi:uncharacterized protein LOC141633704 isoform X2 [Silene latifolia]|uniref:uncharacterized protein LOC141633704 isoform X2 n=1 Tax=Silene latifolia TaxID=37657 RepID=UPI003D76E886
MYMGVPQKIYQNMCMHNTRRSKGPVTFDPEIEKTARRLRKEFLEKKAEEALHLDKFFCEKEIKMAEKTLKQLATPDVTTTPLSIVFPTLQKPLKLNSSFLNLLPKFYGRSNELPNMHLVAFDLACSSMESEGVKPEDIKLRSFPFSLEESAKEWLFYLPPGSITSWDKLKIAFLEKFQPASRVASIRKEISGIKQGRDESLCEYWERFNRLCASCPQHQISEQLLLFYFYEGLLTKDRGYIDAASGGSLAEKTPTEARNLINNMALNTQQFGTRRDVGEASRVNNVDITSIKDQMQENAQQIATLTTLVSKLVSDQSKPTVCSMNSDIVYTDTAGQPFIIANPEQVNALDGFNNQQRKYDPLSNTYNEGWKDHPNLRYGSGPRPQQNFQNNFQNNFRQQAPQPPSLEEMMKQLTSTVSQVHNQGVSYQQKTDAHLQQIDTQMGQICTTLSNIQTTLGGKLPAQPIPNPKESAQSVTLRSGRVLSEPEVNANIEKELEVRPLGKPEVEGQVIHKSKGLKSDLTVPTFKDPSPFPTRFAKTKKIELENEILKTFRKVELNLPLLDAIKQIPKYAKFLKELCTNKRNIKNKTAEKVSVGENVSALIQRKVPTKFNDPGMFSIPCTIGSSKFERCMLDLGASINVMPKSVYESLHGGKLVGTDVMIQLADRSYAYPLGVLEDVLVQVGDLIFPADFYILDMGDSRDSTNVPLLLGRPFLKTSRAKIDVHNGILTMEFDGEVITFNIFDAMKYSDTIGSVCAVNYIDVIDWIAQQVFDDDHATNLSDMTGTLVPTSDIVNLSFVDSGKESTKLSLPPSSQKLVPSIIKAPELELKPLPANLKYAFLGENETLPVIISSSLSLQQEEKLLNVLRKYKEAIGWTLADIKGISPTLCMHRIFLEKDAKPSQKPQRRLNP